MKSHLHKAGLQRPALVLFLSFSMGLKKKTLLLLKDLACKVTDITIQEVSLLQEKTRQAGAEQCQAQGSAS